MDPLTPLARRPKERAPLWLAAVALLASAAFRCPGPDPQAGEGAGLGGSGLGGGGTGGFGGAGGCTGTDCNGECVFLDIDPMNCGECGRACSTDNTFGPHCNGGICDSVCVSGFQNFTRPPAPEPDDGCETPGVRVFVTSDPVSALFNGAAGGDIYCQSVALAAGLGPNWVAWLSDSASSPSTIFVPWTVPYLLMDGTVVANDWTDLTDGSLQHGIDLDEHGAPPSGGGGSGAAPPYFEVWTSTFIDGLADEGSNFCLDWTSQSEITSSGFAGASDESWTYGNPQAFCDGMMRLYCFEM